MTLMRSSSGTFLPALPRRAPTSAVAAHARCSLHHESPSQGAPVATSNSAPVRAHSSAVESQAVTVARALPWDSEREDGGKGSHPAREDSAVYDAVMDNWTSRRAVVASGCVAVLLPLLWSYRLEEPQKPAIFPDSNMSLMDARDACMEGASVCSTLYSQMSSSLRQLSAGYISEELFQAGCQRRLSSPFVSEALLAMQAAIPVLGSFVAYRGGRAWVLHSSGEREKFEQLTLTSLQRCRRVCRLVWAMGERRFTPAGVQLLVQDMRFLCSSMDELLTAVATAQQKH